MKIRCKICNRDIDRSEFDNHIRLSHCMDFNQYYEFHTSVTNDECTVCGRELSRLTPWLTIYNPCLNCNLRYYYDSVMMNINKVYELICSNIFIKLFILNPKLMSKLTEFDILKYTDEMYKKFGKVNYDKINMFVLDTKPGMNPNVKVNMNNVILRKSPYNIKPSELIGCEDSYRFYIDGRRYDLCMPEETEYHNNSHYKYNILNRKAEAQSSKKLLLSSGTCIKFYNTNFDRCKSMIKLYRDGKPIYSTSLSERELSYIKYYIMTNTVILRFLLNVLYELIKNSDTLYDYTFLHNMVVVNPNGKFNMLLDWTINSSMLNSENEQLNISIL